MPRFISIPNEPNELSRLSGSCDTTSKREQLVTLLRNPQKSCTARWLFLAASRPSVRPTSYFFRISM